MTDINGLVQEFWTSNGAVRTSFFVMRSSRLVGNFQWCFKTVCSDIVSFLRLLSTS